MTRIIDIAEVIQNWAIEEAAVISLVLFGSRSRPPEAAASADKWSDVDLHLITDAPELFESEKWTRRVANLELCLYVVRPASGDVRKATLISMSGEADIVIIPFSYANKLRKAAEGNGLSPDPNVRFALNEMATIMRGGYRFLKGQAEWGLFYSQVCANYPGQRLTLENVVQLAEIYLCELLGLLQKLERGELVVAQRLLHRALAETNYQLLHEARLRRGQLSFREARRLERLLPRDELELVQVSAQLESESLRQAVTKSYATMCKLLAELAPEWRISEGFAKLLAAYLEPSAPQ